MRGGQRVQYVEREFEAVAFFGVDRQVDVRFGRRFDQRPDPRQQLGKHALALRVFVAREQRAELDRDAVGAVGAGRGAPVRDRGDRVRVRRDVAPRIGLGARALAEHVVAEAQPLQGLARRRGFAHRLLDRAAEHELAAEQLDRAHGRGDDRLRTEAFQEAALGLVLGQELLRQRDRARRQVGEHLVRAAGPGARTARSVRLPGIEVGLAELIGGQCNRGFGIGHAQQRFGQPHQREAFGAGDRVLLQQGFHGPEGRRIVAHRLHPGPRRRHRGAPVDLALRRSQQLSQHRELVAVRSWQASGSGGDGEHGEPR